MLSSYWHYYYCHISVSFILEVQKEPVRGEKSVKVKCLYESKNPRFHNDLVSQLGFRPLNSSTLALALALVMPILPQVR